MIVLIWDELKLDYAWMDAKERHETAVLLAVVLLYSFAIVAFTS